MQINNTLLQDKQRTLMLVSLAVITVHLVNASLFHFEGSNAEKVAWAALALLANAAANVVYPALDRLRRGLLLLAYGLPALIVGVGIHAVHVAELGFEGSSYTGVPMLFAGAVLSITGTTILVRSVHDWWRRLLLAPVGVALVLFGVLPVTLGVFATNVARVPACCGETPADRGLAYEDVTFETEQGLTLSAWFIPSTNGATIITVHGAGTNRSTVMDEAAMLVRHGYGVLMVDLEGFGDSDGRANAFGWVGARDIHAATTYLGTRADVDPARLGGLGLSMGGEVLLQAAGESTDLQAIVSEGSTGRTAADFGEKKRSDLEYAFHRVVGATMELISGESAPPPLKQMVRQIGPRRVLLIGSSVSEERELMPLYANLGGASFDLWLIPEAKHVGGFDLHPEEYEQRVIAFFDGALRPVSVSAQTP